MKNKTCAQAMDMAENLAMFMVLPAWAGSLILLFADKHPAQVSNGFFIGFILLVMVPAIYAITLMNVWGLINTNNSAAGSKFVANAALYALVPAVVILPKDYWHLYVLVGILAANRILLELRMRTVNPTRRTRGDEPAEVEARAQAKARAQSQASPNEAEDKKEVETLRYVADPAAFDMDAMAGMADLKAELLAAAKESVLTDGRGGQLAGKNRNGTILYGEPGNGKTAIAEALAGTLALPIIKMSFGDVASKWVGETTENVVKLFKDARAQAPCVLFMDEIDSLLLSREGSKSGDAESGKTTNQLLTELVTTRGKGVVIIMATNFLDRLDSAAIREGRVDFKVLVPPPNAAARRAIITKALCSVDCDTGWEDAAVAQAVKRWDGFSAARISAVTDEAVRTVIKTGETITFEHFQQAMRKLQGSHGIRLPADTPTLDQLHMTEQPHRVLQSVAKRMVSIEEIEKLGGSVPSGLLLAGPPGTGKTLAVRSLAKTTGWPLLTSAGADLIADTANIDALVSKAKNARPCIVFIDEADDVFSDRRSGSSYSASITNKLLTAMDGVGGKVCDILWVAAVNAPETMDSASLRGGRFTEKAWFENPDADTVELIVQQWLDQTSAKFAEGITARKIAELVEGESPANIREVLQQAVNNMISRALGSESDGMVVLSDIEAAKASVLI